MTDDQSLAWFAEANRVTQQLAREHDARRIETGRELRSALTTFGPFYQGLLARRDADHAGISAIDAAPVPPPTPATVATLRIAGLLFTAPDAGSDGNRITVMIAPPPELSAESKRKLEAQGVPTRLPGFDLTIALGTTTERHPFVPEFALRQRIQGGELPLPALTTPSKLADVVWVGAETPLVGTYQLAGGSNAIVPARPTAPASLRGKDDASYVFRLDAFRSYTLPQLEQLVSTAIINAEQWLAAGGA